ncbi:MAG TPA: nucleoside triphosphate pyrophosphohydrolase [Bacteroidales bacterium]|nr:nucleoside triphosphate pyrophosphohydrolase [Bacteroidales bacterium]
MESDRRLTAFKELLDIMDRLRDSCPWDMKQTNESLRKLTIEETYELADAILDKDDKAICKELGDLMLHIVFYSRIGSEKKSFDITSVLEGINRKLVYRHPHVFGDTHVSSATEVEDNWEKLKLNESDTYKPVLSGVPKSLPALVKANRIQEKVRGVGFDWEDRKQVWDKVAEEINEFKKEITKGDKEKIELEFGDVLFSLINAARLYEIDPESALERTNKKFISRFNYLEKETIQQGKSLHDMSLEEMDKIWEKAKDLE